MKKKFIFTIFYIILITLLFQAEEKDPNAPAWYKDPPDDADNNRFVYAIAKNNSKNGTIAKERARLQGLSKLVEQINHKACDSLNVAKSERSKVSITLVGAEIFKQYGPISSGEYIYLLMRAPIEPNITSMITAIKLDIAKEKYVKATRKAVGEIEEIKKSTDIDGSKLTTITTSISESLKVIENALKILETNPQSGELTFKEITKDITDKLNMVVGSIKNIQDRAKSISIEVKNAQDKVNEVLAKAQNAETKVIATSDMAIAESETANAEEIRNQAKNIKTPSVEIEKLKKDADQLVREINDAKYVKVAQDKVSEANTAIAKQKEPGKDEDKPTKEPGKDKEKPTKESGKDEKKPTKESGKDEEKPTKELDDEIINPAIDRDQDATSIPLDFDAPPPAPNNNKEPRKSIIGKFIDFIKNMFNANDRKLEEVANLAKENNK